MFKLINSNIKDNKGFTAVDVSISIILVILFISVIGMLLYNIYISSSTSLRSAYALGYAIDIIETIDNTEYEQLDEQYAESIISNLEIPESYTTEIQVQQYNQLPGNEDKLDLIKIVDLKLTYKVGDNDQVLQISRLKVK